MNLKRILYVTIAVCSIAIVIFYFITDRPKGETFTGTIDISDSSKRFPLYTLNNTTIFLNHGDIYDLKKCPDLKNAALAITTKFNLGQPFYSESANSKLFNKMTDSLSVRLIKDDFLQLKEKQSNELWVDKLENQYPELNNVPIYLCAGIPAKPKTTKEAKISTFLKPKKVFDVTRLLCSNVCKNGSENVAMTLFGTGAASIDQGIAIENILSAINESASIGQAPREITIVLFSKYEGVTEAERNAWLRETTLNFQYIIEGENGKNIWNVQNRNMALIQLLLLIVAPCIAGLIALNTTRLRERIWWGPIGSSIVKWALVATGFFTLSQASVFNLQPIEDMNFVIFIILAIVAPLWEWFKVSELKDNIVHDAK